MAEPRAYIERLLSPALRAQQAYVVPPADGLVKLDAMENPWPLPEELREPWLDGLRDLELNRYPDSAAAGLKADLRRNLGVDAACELVLGNGSDELIQLLAMALAGPQRAVLAPQPSFSMYPLIAAALGARFVGVDLRDDLTLDLDAMIDAIEREQPTLVFLAYPNNPTGNLFDARAIERIVMTTRGLVVIDEAYHAFAGATLLDAVVRYPNLVVLRTLSKSGLAALRLGLLIAPSAWARELEKLRLPYNIGSLTQRTARFALEHAEVFERQARRICSDRDELAGACAALEGVQVHPSATNFLLLKLRCESAAACAALREAGVLVKDAGAMHTLTRQCIRVSVGTPAENRVFVAALSEVVSALPDA